MFFQNVKDSMQISEMEKKNWEYNLDFWDNCTLISCVKHSLLPTENSVHWE